MKLWDKGTPIDAIMESFTVGDDRTVDVRLARWDVVGSIAHAEMLGAVGLVTRDEAALLVDALSELLVTIDTTGIVIEDGVEDIHSQVEKILTAKLGDVGKKVHTGRSRNDQVLVDLKLFLRHELRALKNAARDLAQLLLDQAEVHKDVLLPGYTHYQVAMPSSAALWLGGYAEALIEDMRVLDMAIDAANANPLGSAAGYGSRLPLDRHRTTEALNFDRVHVTSTFAQMSRGRTEKLAALAIGQVASTLSRFASDVVHYVSQNYAFVSLPDSLTTGSSIMPHKKNPDVFEVLRARCNRLQSVAQEITLVCTNLPSGYHRDMQFTKDRIVHAIDELGLCLRVAQHVTPMITPRRGILDNEMYDGLFSVDRVDDLVRQGVPFREAYRRVGQDVANGKSMRNDDAAAGAESAALGSVSNPGLDELRRRLTS
ncbi:MAG: argininosuccinate lyase [Ignavibacteria bacterium]|jgi:argininosuccinate lyase